MLARPSSTSVPSGSSSRPTRSTSRPARGSRTSARSRKGVLRSFNPMPGGRRRDAIYYSVLRGEWPGVAAALTAGRKGSSRVTVPLVHAPRRRLHRWARARRGTGHAAAGLPRRPARPDQRALAPPAVPRRAAAGPGRLRRDHRRADSRAAGRSCAVSPTERASPSTEAVLLQVRREILGYQKLPTMGDCTTYARTGPDPVLAQTVDLNGDLDDHIAVLDVATGARRSLVLSFGGLLGYLGVNDAGLAVGLNLVLGGAVAARAAAVPGDPPRARQREQRRRSAGGAARVADGQLPVADAVRPHHHRVGGVRSRTTCGSCTVRSRCTPTTSCTPTSCRATS